MVARIGVLSFAMALLVNWSRSRVDPDPEFIAATTAVTDENFADVVLASEKPVVVDFYGDYCMVCRQLESELVTLAKDHSETAVFARVNVQDAPELIQRYEVPAVPTLVVIHRGNLLFQGAGLSALLRLQSVLAGVVSGNPPRTEPEAALTVADVSAG